MFSGNEPKVEAPRWVVACSWSTTSPTVSISTNISVGGVSSRTSVNVFPSTLGAKAGVGVESGVGSKGTGLVAARSGCDVSVHIGGSDAGAGVLDTSPPGSTSAPRVQADARAKLSAKKMSRDTLETDQRGLRQTRCDRPRSSACSLNFGSSFQSSARLPRKSIATLIVMSIHKLREAQRCQ